MSSKSPGPKSRKQFLVQVLMLDDVEVPFQIEAKTIGNELINMCYQYLKLIESDYFGLEFLDLKGKKCWLDYDKAVSKQVNANSKLIFCVKFYTPDPGQLEEEYTRYLYALQIKRDLSDGLLLCSDATASLLVSYILQAEIGDYVDTYNNSTSYFNTKKYFPHQNEEHEKKILDYHRNHVGQSPADADLNLLDIARKIELYGIIMHSAKDHEGVSLNLAVAHMGILVFQNFTKINTFSWAKIRKLSFKRKKFLVKLHPENYGFYKDTVEFYFENRDDSKNFWKECIEHHSFFRCISTQRMPRQKSKLLTRGSSYRYYGRTQKELIESARENFSKNRSFDRSYHSMRSISQFYSGDRGERGSSVGPNSSNNQINGTQSLNRNLASRSTGAILVPTSNTTNVSSTLSSNSSCQQNFNNFNQNLMRNSTHHLSYVPSSELQQQQNQSHTQVYGTNGRLGGASGISTQKNGEQLLTHHRSITSLNQSNTNSFDNKQQYQQYRSAGENTINYDNSSTHGSRTIDSRHSRDKTLGLSDEDIDDDDQQDQEDTDEEDDKTNAYDIENENEYHKCTCGKQHENEEAEEDEQEDEEQEEEQDDNQEPTQFEPRSSLKTNEPVNNNTTSFKIPSSAINNKNLISLPIQQQLLKPITTGNNSAHTTDNESSSAAPKLQHTLPITNTSNNISGSTNPNKIYSRKEVITTYKEETKNTHLEEYQTTTFYDQQQQLPLSSLTQGKPQNSGPIHIYKDLNKQYPQQTSPLPPPPPPPPTSIGIPQKQSSALYAAPLKISHQLTTHTTTTTQQNTTLLDVVHNNLDNVDSIINDNNNDEAKKNDQCSLAAKIIYSNLQTKNDNNNQSTMINRPYIERIKRPSTLIKPVSILNRNSASPNSNNESTSSQTRNNITIQASKSSNFNRLKHKPLLKSSTQTTDNEDHFPPPPPIPHHQNPHQHQHTNNTNNHTNININRHPLMLKDYEEPIQNHKLIPSATVNVNVKLFPQSHVNNNFNKTASSSTSYNKNISTNTSFFNTEEELKRKKNPSNPVEESYYIVKELVMTERTFTKDLYLLTQTFRQFAVTKNFDLSELLLFDQLLYPEVLEPVYEFHTQFLKDLEMRLFYWTDKSNSKVEEYHKIGDILIRLGQVLKNYQTYIEKYEDILNELDLACKKNKKFDALFKDFESQKICYLPFTLFLLKPIQRLIHYKNLCERLLIFYGLKHYDYHETYSIYGKIEEFDNLISEKLSSIENKQKLMELQRDLIGVDNLASKQFRYFIREGSLQKLSRKGYQQRMFFLFNDSLLYCARSSSPLLQFKVHGEYHLKNLQVEDGNSHISLPNSFTIYSSNRSLLVAAASQDEKRKWLQDLYEAIEKAKNVHDEKHNYYSLKSNSSSDNNLDSIQGIDDECNQSADTVGSNDNPLSTNSLNEQKQQQSQHQQQHRANTTMHVCWHRNCSVSSTDNHRSLINQLSGYLLRKFKNSNGWQKLWVVFTNFCLFFYKTYQDEFPLASLPLLGYTITVPSDTDGINKEFVFKLKFKNHVYFFRADSQYAYDRWLEAIESAAQKQCLIANE